MTPRRPPLRGSGRHGQRGVALLESLLAVVILGIALIGTLGLQARSTAALADAGLRAEATIAANQLVGIMSSDLANLDAYALAAGATPGTRLAAWHADLRSRIPGASVSIALSKDGSSVVGVDIAIGWQRTSDSQRNVHRITSWLSPAK